MARPSSTEVVPHQGSARAKASVKRDYKIQSLAIGMSVLEVFAKSGAPRALTELSVELGISKWRLFRHLNTLVDEGYLVQDPATKRFLIGPRLNSFRGYLSTHHEFADQARFELEWLQRETALSVLLSDRGSDAGVTIIASLPGTQAYQFSIEIGAVLDLHASAHGKVALAFSASPIRLRPPNYLSRRTEKTITSHTVLMKEIEQVREQGWADAPEQGFLGVNSVVAPVFAANRLFEGGLGVIGAVGQIPAKAPSALVRSVLEAARRLSERMGYNA
jgi:IclR family KDG regulon transcriptional repressor